MYVELSTEDGEEGERGPLKRAMCGTRDAAQNWEAEYTEMLLGAGFAQGEYSACVFYHEQEKLRVVLHGDDFTALGESKSLDGFRGAIQKRTEVRFKGRLERGRLEAVIILNRNVSVTEKGLEYEADQRHAEVIENDLGLTPECKGVATRVVSVKRKRKEEKSWQKLTRGGTEQ